MRWSRGSGRVNFQASVGVSFHAPSTEAIDEAERRVRAVVPSARIIYLEPDCYRAGAPVERASAPDP